MLTYTCTLPSSVRVPKRCVGSHRDSIGSTEIDQFFVREVRVDLDLIKYIHIYMRFLLLVIHITCMCIFGLCGIILYQITKTPCELKKTQSITV